MSGNAVERPRHALRSAAQSWQGITRDFIERPFFLIPLRIFILVIISHIQDDLEEPHHKFSIKLS